MSHRLLIPTALLLASCKMMPNAIRSGTSNSEVSVLLDQSSVSFTRGPDGTNGTMKFTLKDLYNCRVEYWADDPNGTPSPTSPLTADCPIGKNLEQSVTLNGLKTAYPISARIYVWPQALNLTQRYAHVFREGQDLSKASAQTMVIVRYQSPRNSGEIYAYRLPNALNMDEIKKKLGGEGEGCTLNPGAESQPFARSTSMEDQAKRPLFGLSEISTDGYGVGAATVHPFFPSRIVNFYDAIERQQMWTWNFKWENSAHTFESYPPGYIATLSVGDGQTQKVVSSRSLAGTLDSVSIDGQALSFEPKIIYPTEVAHFELAIKSADAAETLLRCRFGLDKPSYQVPTEILNQLPAGSYLGVFSLETSQVHFRDQSSYPPWLITAQDWIQFRLNKRL